MAHPPYYVLLAHSALPASQSPPQPPPTLSHPRIQYHYADDPPFLLIPTPSEPLVVLDFTSDSPCTAKSLSPHAVVTGVKISPAPGPASDDPRRNHNMYILETVSTDQRISMDDSLKDMHNPHAALARFKRRNSILRRALHYPDPAVAQPRPPVLSSPELLS